MANITYVDWDGLVYYDGKIKAYISDAIRDSITVGGILKYESLPDPSQNNLNHLYKITDAFVSTEERFDVVDRFPKGAWVLCIQTETREFKYTIFDGITDIDFEQVYSKAETDALVNNLRDEVDNTYVSKEELYFTQFIFDCGTASEEDTQSLIEYIKSNELPAFISDEENVYSTPWNELDIDKVAYDEQGYYHEYNRFGYQVAFTGNENLIAQSFSIPQGARIIAAYRYDLGGLNEWLPQEAPPSIEWIEDSDKLITINGEDYMYTNYVYNVGDMGNAILTDEYWRFEIGA